MKNKFLSILAASLMLGGVPQIKAMQNNDAPTQRQQNIFIQTLDSYKESRGKRCIDGGLIFIRPSHLNEQTIDGLLRVTYMPAHAIHTSESVDGTFYKPTLFQPGFNWENAQWAVATLPVPTQPKVDQSLKDYALLIHKEFDRNFKLFTKLINDKIQANNNQPISMEAVQALLKMNGK